MNENTEAQELPEQPKPQTLTVLEAATAAGHLPEELRPTRLKPSRLNRQTWIYRTALVLKDWAPDTQITQSDYEAAAAAIVGSHAR
jgi:hypothetical protein